MGNDFGRRCRGGHGGLDDKDLVFVLWSDGKRLVNSLQQIGQVSLPVFSVRRTHTVVDAIAFCHSLCKAIGADRMEPMAEMPCERLIKSMFQKRQLSVLNGAQALVVHLNTVDCVSIFSKAQRCGKPHESQAKNSNRYHTDIVLCKKLFVYHLYSLSGLSLRNCRKRATPSCTGMVGL